MRARIGVGIVTVGIVSSAWVARPGAHAAAGDGAAATPPVQVALSTNETARVERLLSDRLACLGCHRLAGEGGQIGPPLDGLAERATAEQVLAWVRDPASMLAGTRMPRQPVPDADALRLVRYLLSFPAAAPSPGAATPEPPPALDPARAMDGAALYGRHCASCHGAEGRADGWNAANLPTVPLAHADPALMRVRTDDRLYDAVAAGAWVLDGDPRMPAFGELLSAEQIRALVRHMRVLCSCEGPEWSRDGDGG